MTTHRTSRTAFLHRRSGDDDGVELSPRPAGPGDDAAERTCADFIPLSMRDDQPASPASAEQRREVYREARAAQRRAFARIWGTTLVVWGAALALVINGIDDESPVGGAAHAFTYLLPLALVVALPALYAGVRGRGRIDALEDEPEKAASREGDCFPADRWVPVMGTMPLLLIAAPLALVPLGFVWLLLFIDESLSPLDIVIGILVTGAVLVGLAWLAAAGRRLCVRETPDGLVVQGLRRRTVLPWSDVQQLRVELVEDRGPRGTDRSLRLGLDARSLPRTLGWPVHTWSAGTRARARHNITVARRWTVEHGVDGSPSLDAGIAWAEGAISRQELQERAHLVVKGIRA